jgi:hypothetical protein
VRSRMGEASSARKALHRAAAIVESNRGDSSNLKELLLKNDAELLKAMLE